MAQFFLFLQQSRDLNHGPGSGAAVTEVLRILAAWRDSEEVRTLSSARCSQVCVGPGSAAAFCAMMSPCWGSGHAEDPARLTAVMTGLHALWEEGLRWDLLPDEPYLLDDELFSAVYTPRFRADFAAVEAGGALERHNISLPNVAGAESPAQLFAVASRHAAGTVVQLARLAASGTIARGFAVVRPPGHHGTSSSSGGNGVLNSVALATVAVAAAGTRVLIVDLDVHFSGGTVEILRGASLCSPTAGPLVPNAVIIDIYGARGQELRSRAQRDGRRWEIIEKTENATCINVALLDPAAGDSVYLSDAVLGEVMRRWDAHNPDLVLVSLGFDALVGDDEGFQLSAAGMGAFVGAMSSRCKSHCGDLSYTCSSESVDPASRSPVPALIVVLEGGYKLPLLREAAGHVMRALLLPTS